WAAAAIVTRNLILNWLVILPMIALVVILLKWFAGSVEAISEIPAKGSGLGLYAALGGSAIAFIFAMQFAIRQRPGSGQSSSSQVRFLLCDVLPTLAGLIGITFALAIGDSPESMLALSACEDPEQFACLASLGTYSAPTGVVLYGLSWLVG